ELARQMSEFYEQKHGTSHDPVAAAQIARVRPGMALVERRTDAMSDRDWYRLPFVNEQRRAWEFDESIYCNFQLLDERRGAICFGRSWRSRPFSEADRTIVEIFVEQCAKLLLVPELVRLSPRERQVLALLLDGAAPKQIATALGLSINTVNQYIRCIYRAYDVTTREELLTRFLRHGDAAIGS